MRLPLGWDQSVYFAEYPKFGDTGGEDSGCKTPELKYFKLASLRRTSPYPA
jgi:hypothetical protein